MAVDATAESHPVDDATYGDVARQLHRMTASTPEKVHVDSDTAHVYLLGPKPDTRAGTPAMLDSADVIDRALRSTDPRLVELGWTTAARYAMTVTRARWRQGWATAATNADVRNALLAMWRLDMSLAAFDDVSLRSLAWALEETRAVTSDFMLNRAQSHTIEELVRRELFGDVPWTPIQAAVQAGTNWWQTQLQLATTTVAPVLAWLATQVETCDDPDNLWVVVNSCSPAFTGTTAELLAAAADTCGIAIDCGPERTRLPIVIHLDDAQ